MQNQWPKHSFKIISTALCSILHGDVMCYVRTSWTMFTR